MQLFKKTTLTETVRLNRLCWFGHVQRMEENRIPKRVFYMNLGITNLRGRPRNRWQNEVGVNGRIASGEGWQEKVYNREEWKKLLSMARNHRFLYMPMEWMNDEVTITAYCWTLCVRNSVALYLPSKDGPHGNIYFPCSKCGNCLFQGHIDALLDHKMQENFMHCFPGGKKCVL